MPKLSDLSAESRFVGLFVGQSGSGKTVAEASFPTPINFQDFDGRIRGVLGAPWLKNLDKMTYDYYEPKSSGLITKLNDKLESFNALAKSSQAAGNLPTTLVTDSLTNQCYAFLCQAIPLTHGTEKDRTGGKWIGPVSMAGPQDYGFEAQGIYDYIAFLKSLPITNIIVSAHLVDRYAKADPSNEFSDSIVVGEKLSVRDKIGVNIQTHFDHVFKFEREMFGTAERFFVTFRGGIARTSYAKLPNGRVDITGKNFYETMIKLALNS